MSGILNTAGITANTSPFSYGDLVTTGKQLLDPDRWNGEYSNLVGSFSLYSDKDGIRSSSGMFYPPEPPRVKVIEDPRIEKWLTQPRAPCSLPILVGDYLNKLVLPADWDPTAHLHGTGMWWNRTRFFSEASAAGFTRIPIIPRIGERYP